MVAAFSDQDRQILKDKNFAHLSTLGPGGAPSNSVLWVDEQHGQLVMNTTMDRAKVKNIERNPLVSVSIHNQENPYAYFAVQGRAELDRDGADAMIDFLAHKYLGQNRYPEEWRAPHEQRVVIRVVPERIHRYGY